MNKRLTDRERNALKRWLDNPESKPEELSDANLSTLIRWVFESEKAAREEVERLKGKNKHLQEWKEAKERIDDVSHIWWHEETAKIKHLFPLENSPGIGQIVEMLLMKESQLQDALNTLNWYVDSSMAEYVDDAGVKAAEMLERIQEGCGDASM